MFPPSTAHPGSLYVSEAKRQAKAAAKAAAKATKGPAPSAVHWLGLMFLELYSNICNLCSQKMATLADRWLW